MRFKILTLLMISIFFIEKISAQSENNDTLTNYLKNFTIQLMNPHVNLNFSYSGAEIKNTTPSMKVEIPALADTAKYQAKLKGDYQDWQRFLDIAKIYRRYNMYPSAYPYMLNAYNVINAEIKKDSLNAKYYSDMADLYLQIDNQEYAQAYLNMAYQLNPEDSMVLSLLPTFLAQSGDLEKAKKITKTALKKNPADIEAYINLYNIKIFEILMDSVKINNFKNNKPEEIIDLQKLDESAKKFNDLSFYVLHDVVNLYVLFLKVAVNTDDFSNKIMVSKEDEVVLKKIIKSLKKKISNPAYKNKHILYKSLGYCYLLKRDFDEALLQFKKMMQFWPADNLSEDYDIIFATEFYLKKDTLNALKTLQEKIEHQKKMLLIAPIDYIRLGNLYLQINKFSEAKKAYENALNLSNQAVEAYLGLSVIEMMNMNFQEANKYMNIAYEINRDNYLTYTLFGVLTLMANDYEQAKSALEQAMQLKPDSEEIKNLYQTFFNN